MRGKAHSEEVRAQVMAALLAGQGVSEVAKEYSIDPSLIRRWRREQLPDITREKRERIGALVLLYLEKNVECLVSQLEVAGNAQYLKKQSAAEFATLHGIIADKGFSVLSAIERASGSEDTTG